MESKKVSQDTSRPHSPNRSFESLILNRPSSPSSLPRLVNQDTVSVVKTVELSYNMVLLVRDNWLHEARLDASGFLDELDPLGLDAGSLLLDLGDLRDKVHVPAVLAVAADLLESLWVDVSKDVSQSAQGVLKHVVPVVLSQVDDYWYQNWESFTLVVLQDRKEEIILKETHSSIRHLQMRTSNRLNQSLEQLLYVRLKLRNVANIQHFKQLLQEHSFLSEIGEWPVSQKSFNELKNNLKKCQINLK